MNYRLGAFGWLNGETFKGEGGTPNAGLQDQRLALSWIQEYIGLFGGDKDRCECYLSVICLGSTNPEI